MPSLGLAAVASAICVVSMSLGAPIASAAPASMSTDMPMSSQWRACDFSALKWVKARGDARAVAHVNTDGAGNVTATVDIATAQPDAFLRHPRNPDAAPVERLRGRSSRRTERRRADQ